MKPITEQRQQELIEHCKRVMGESSPDGLEYPIAEIALASLTAKPIAVTDSSEIDDLKNEGWVGNFLAPEFQGVDSEDRVYLYTAPPVPVIKVVAYLSNHGDALTPGDFAGGEDEMHTTGKQEGWTPLYK